MFNKDKVIAVIIFVFFITVVTVLAGEPKRTFDLTDPGQWTTHGKQAEVVTFQGKEALRIQPGYGQGYALLKGVEFENGIIEVDIAALPYFTGIVFRLAAENDYEAIYFRPQNARHTDPEKRRHTVQYVSHPDYPWQYLRQNFPDQYEAAVDIPPGEWFHVRLEINGTGARVFVNGSERPCLEINDLKHGARKGSVGVWTGNTSGGTFADFNVRKLPAEDDQGKPVTLTPEQEYLFETFQRRRSVRSYKPDPVPDEHIEKILDAARTAPTAGNQQPWKFLVVKNREKLEELKKACIENSLARLKMSGLNDDQLKAREQQTMAYYDKTFSAPVYVVVLVDKHSKYPSYNKHDGPLAAGYLMIAARALGYGTVFYTDSIPEDLTMKVLDIPDQFERICITPLGIPESWPASPAKKPLGEFIASEKFIEGVNYTRAKIRKEIKLDAGIMEGYTGKYELQPGFVLTITLENGQLFTQATGQQKVEIFPETETEFFLKVTDARITFTRDKSGRVTGLTLHQAGRDFPGKKID